MNRGLLLSAKEISFNNETNEVSLVFEDTTVHGDVDGGHTYKIIKHFAPTLERGEQYVKVEVLTGIEEIFEQLAAARNTSVQVKDQSIAELENRFNLIKEAFRNERFYNDISYKENDVKRIDVSDIYAIDKKLNPYTLEEKNLTFGKVRSNWKFLGNSSSNGSTVQMLKTGEKGLIERIQMRLMRLLRSKRMIITLLQLKIHL